MPDTEELLARRGEKLARRANDRDGPRRRFFSAGAFACLLALILAAPTASAQEKPDKIAIVATIADLRSLAQAVGGDRIAAVSLVPPHADPEDYQPRPQDVARLKDARLVVSVGLDFDLWFDKLIVRAGRDDLKRRRPDHIDASGDITLLDVHAHGIGPGDGHAHGSGNPHYWLDPKNAEIVTAHVLVRLAEIDPANAASYEANRIRFLERLDAKLKEWEGALVPLKGRAIVAHHNSWAYLARRFRLDFVDSVEPKPGVAPSPAHLNRLLKKMKDRDVRILVRESREPEKNLAFLAEKTGARIAVLAGSVGAVPGADDFLALFDHNVRALVAAASP